MQRYYAPDGQDVTRQVRKLAKTAGLLEPADVLAFKYDEPGKPARFLTKNREIWPEICGQIPPPVAYAGRFWSTSDAYADDTKRG